MKNSVAVGKVDLNMTAEDEHCEKNDKNNVMNTLF